MDKTLAGRIPLKGKFSSRVLHPTRSNHIYEMSGDSRAIQKDVDILTSQNGETLLNTCRAKVIATVEALLKSLKANFKKIELIY